MMTLERTQMVLSSIMTKPQQQTQKPKHCTASKWCVHSCSRTLVILGHPGWEGTAKQTEIFLPYWSCLILLPYWKSLCNILPTGETPSGICQGLALKVLTHVRTYGCLPSTVTMVVAVAEIWATESRILSSAQGNFFFLYHWHFINGAS